MAEGVGAKVVELKKKNKITGYDLTGDVVSKCDIDFVNMVSLCRNNMRSGKMTAKEAIDSQVLKGIQDR